MTIPKWLTLIGAVFLLAGLLTAFLSSHYTERIQGQRRMGVIVFGPTEGTQEWQETQRLLDRADYFFYAGLALTAIGVLLQTLGATLPDGSRDKNVADSPNLPAVQDPLAHVPRYDKTKEPPDDQLDEEGTLRALKEANAVLSKKRDQ